MSIARKLVSDEGLHVAPYVGMEANQGGLEPAYRRQHNNYSQEYAQSSPQSSHKHERYADWSPGQHRKKLCGIPILAFWLLLALVIALIAAIVVMGGVLGFRHTSSSTPTPTATSNTPPTTVTTSASAVAATGAFECTKNNTLFTSATGSVFTTLCNQDLGMGADFNNTDADLYMVNVTSYGACIDACALSRAEGLQWSVASGSCAAVIWSSEGSGHGSCYFKNGTGKPHYAPPVYAAILHTN